MDDYEVATFDDGSAPSLVVKADTGEALLISPSFATEAEAEALVPIAAAAFAAQPEGCRVEASAGAGSIN